MEWFGISQYGPTDPIKDMMREDYKEPTERKDLFEAYIAGGSKGRFVDLIKEIDIYIGQADGYAYKSYERLIKMRKKGNFKPVGPSDMYRYEGCASMKVGWFLSDPALKDETWFKSQDIYQ